MIYLNKVLFLFLVYLTSFETWKIVILFAFSTRSTFSTFDFLDKTRFVIYVCICIFISDKIWILCNFSIHLECHSKKFSHNIYYFHFRFWVWAAWITRVSAKIYLFLFELETDFLLHNDFLPIHLKKIHSQ